MTGETSSAFMVLPRYLVPVRPERLILQDHAVVVKDDRIIQVLPTTQARQVYPGLQEVSLPHHVVTPGLINMHTHSPMTLLRGFADDLPLQEWLNEYIWPVEKKFVSPEFVADGTRLAMAEMLRAGTTCFNDNYFFPDTMADVVEQAGMRACIGLPVIELATSWAADVEEYLEKGLEVLQRNNSSRLLKFSLAPHAPYSVSDKTLLKIEELSRQFEIPVHMHLLETRREIDHSLDQYGIEPLQRLVNLGVLNQRLLAVHMTQLSEQDIALVAESGLHVINCPQSCLKLASGFCPIIELLTAGVNIAVGTDGAASNNNLDLLSEVQTAALLAKGVSGNAQAIDAFSALEMITINSARALRLEKQLGSIEPGKQADFVALDLNQPETQPLYNVVSQLIYAASSRQFTDVWVAGRRLLQDGQLTTLDQDSILAAADAWRSRISSH